MRVFLAFVLEQKTQCRALGAALAMVFSAVALAVPSALFLMPTNHAYAEPYYQGLDRDTRKLLEAHRAHSKNHLKHHHRTKPTKPTVFSLEQPPKFVVPAERVRRGHFDPSGQEYLNTKRRHGLRGNFFPGAHALPQTRRPNSLNQTPFRTRSR